MGSCKKQSRAYAKRHLGRLYEDGHVAICDSFKGDYPPYAQGNWFWGAYNNLVIEDEYLAYFPNKPGPKEELEEDPQQEHTVTIGAPWTMQTICSQHDC